MTTIVKIQASVHTSCKVQQVLIYNKARDRLYEGPLTEQLKVLMNGRDKVYAKASCVHDEFIILRLVSQQPW